MFELIVQWGVDLYRSQFLLPGLINVTHRRAPYDRGIDTSMYGKVHLTVSVVERLPDGTLLGKIEEVE